MAALDRAVAGGTYPQPTWLISDFPGRGAGSEKIQSALAPPGWTREKLPLFPV